MVENKKDLKAIQRLMGHPIRRFDEGKTLNQNYHIENCLKSVVKEIWK